MLKTIAAVVAGVAIGSVGVAVTASSADAGKAAHTGHYRLTNNAQTQITTIKVRNPSCLNGEDSAGVLKMVQTIKGYQPSQGKVTYRCHHV